MGSELERFRGGGEVARFSRAQRREVERLDMELFRLVNEGRQEEVKAIIRKRLIESGMEDVTDAADYARQLAGGDAYIASLLIPMVQEYARTTARDIRDFGRGQ